MESPLQCQTVHALPPDFGLYGMHSQGLACGSIGLGKAVRFSRHAPSANFVPGFGMRARGWTRTLSRAACSDDSIGPIQFPGPANRPPTTLCAPSAATICPPAAAYPATFRCQLTGDASSDRPISFKSGTDCHPHTAAGRRKSRVPGARHCASAKSHAWSLDAVKPEARARRQISPVVRRG